LLPTRALCIDGVRFGKSAIDRQVGECIDSGVSRCDPINAGAQDFTRTALATGNGLRQLNSV
jgi:hypothetical protein